MPNGKRGNIPAQSLYDLANIRGRQQLVQQAGQMATQPGAGGYGPLTALTSLLSGFAQRGLAGQQADIMTQAKQQQEVIFGQIEDIIDMDLPPEQKIEQLTGLWPVAQQVGITNLPQIVNMLVKTKGEKIKSPTPQQIMAKLTRLSRQPSSLLTNRKIFLNPSTIANRKAEYSYYWKLGQQHDEVKAEGFLPVDQVPWSSFGKSAIEPAPPKPKKKTGLPFVPGKEVLERRAPTGPAITQVPAPTPEELARVDALISAGNIDAAESLIEELSAKYPQFKQ